MIEDSDERMDFIEGRITDLVIRLAILSLFIFWSLMLVRPFLPVFVWAVVLAVALSPLHRIVASWLGGSRVIASVLITLMTLLVIIGPVTALALNFSETVHSVLSRRSTGQLELRNLPDWIATLPVVGERVTTFWALAASNLDTLIVQYRDTLAPIGGAILGLISRIGVDLLKFIVAVILAGVLLVSGPGMVAGGRRLASRIVAPRGAQFVDLAGATIRSVSRGVVGVAVLQSLLIGIVMLAMGISGAGLLTFLIFILCIIQIGPALVVLPLLIWAWFSLGTGSALLLTVLLVPLTVMDNVLKPMLMGRGLSTPAIVIFLGVVGGTLSYGLIGLFLGPIVLAVFYDLLISWMKFGSPDSGGSPSRAP